MFGFTLPMTPQSMSGLAEVLIRQSGARTTAARVRVLSFLMQQQSAVTHHEIETAMGQQEKIDRVTLYRTLDWLVAEGLTHKVLSADRVWRFRVSQDEAAHRQHAHFKCDHCGTMICLGQMPADAKTPALPTGYRATGVEVVVRGLCAECA
jgi:Fur family ferric uptake transcriptional regulator